MEAFIWIVIIYFAWRFIAGWIRKNELEEIQVKIAEERRKNAFDIKVENNKIDGDEFSWDVLDLSIKGIIEGPRDNFDVKYIVNLIDITSGKDPILCTYEEFQKEDSRVFWYESDVEQLPYASTIFNSWVRVSRIPKMFLEFPRKGQRNLEFTAFVVNPRTDSVYAQKSVKFSYYNEDDGYLDTIDNREYFEKVTVQSAMLVSASDGDMDTQEANVVKEWIRKRLSGYKEEYKEDEKNRLNGYVKEAYDQIIAKKLDIKNVLSTINTIASEGEKYELFQLCLDVAQADGKADESELKFVHEIARLMELNEKQFRSMVEKTLPVTIHATQANDETLLGITSDMTEKEIKKLLREEYQKWNPRVAHADPEIREQAEKMIHIIAEVRKKYSS